MNPTPTIEELSQADIAQLHSDVERYLAAVEAFRAEGCEPVWREDEALGEQRRPVCLTDPGARRAGLRRR